MSDSSYDAEEHPEQSPAETPESPKETTSRCPFSRLSPENIEGTLQHHSHTIEELQGILFFRRPIAFAVIFITVNYAFYLYRVLKGM